MHLVDAFPEVRRRSSCRRSSTDRLPRPRRCTRSLAHGGFRVATVPSASERSGSSSLHRCSSTTERLCAARTLGSDTVPSTSPSLYSSTKSHRRHPRDQWQRAGVSSPTPWMSRVRYPRRAAAMARRERVRHDIRALLGGGSGMLAVAVLTAVYRSVLLGLQEVVVAHLVVPRTCTRRRIIGLGHDRFAGDGPSPAVRLPALRPDLIGALAAWRLTMTPALDSDPASSRDA